MLPHAVAEITEIADHCAVVDIDDAEGWKVQEWTLVDDDVERVVAAYQALLSVDLDGELDQLLVDLGVDRLGPPAESDQQKQVQRADATELLAAATAMAVDGLSVKGIFMPNVPKMAAYKSDSGIDIIGVELNESATGDIGQDERLVLVSVKHTVGKYASSMRGELEKSVTEDLSGPYLHRQLTVIHGRLLQEGVSASTAARVIYFMRETLSHPQVRIVCVGAAEPAPNCNLQDQPPLLTATSSPDAHFRMLLVPGLSTLHEKLIPSG